MKDKCEQLHEIFNQMKRFDYKLKKEEVPKNGIYILFEKGEKAHEKDRIVRVGTHTGTNQLLSRLMQHFINENKDRSIFRKNIGRAILNKENNPLIKEWEIDLTPKKSRDLYQGGIDMKKQKEIEKRVSDYMRGNFTFVVFEVEDELDRKILESKIISTISKCGVCGPSKEWLGLFSPIEKIRNSGMWLVQGLWKEEINQEEINKIKELARLNF